MKKSLIDWVLRFHKRFYISICIKFWIHLRKYWVFNCWLCFCINFMYPWSLCSFWGFMNPFKVFLQISRLREGFFTKITFVISFSFMNCFDMYFQICWCSEWFLTRNTFLISFSFMNCFDMYLQISWLRKGFCTRITFVISFSFMNCLDVYL